MRNIRILRRSNTGFCTNRPPVAEQVQAWLSAQLPDRPHPAVQRPIDWMKWLAKIAIGTGSVIFAVVAWPYMLPVLQSRNIWASVSLISILLFTSGHMFNHIRNVPYVAGDGHGGISYFAGGFQTQYGLETQIVAALCKFSLQRSPSGIPHLITHRRFHDLLRYLSCHKGAKND